jgi:hypothetical protein
VICRGNDFAGIIDNIVKIRGVLDGRGGKFGALKAFREIFIKAGILLRQQQGLMRIAAIIDIADKKFPENALGPFTRENDPFAVARPCMIGIRMVAVDLQFFIALFFNVH